MSQPSAARWNAGAPADQTPRSAAPRPRQVSEGGNATTLKWPGGRSVAPVCCASGCGRAATQTWLTTNSRRCWSAATPAPRPLFFCLVPMLGAIRHARRAVGRASECAFGVDVRLCSKARLPTSSSSVGCSIDLRCIPPYPYYLLADTRKSKPRGLGVYPYTRPPLERLMMRPCL